MFTKIYRSLHNERDSLNIKDWGAFKLALLKKYIDYSISCARLQLRKVKNATTSAANPHETLCRYVKRAVNQKGFLLGSSSIHHAAAQRPAHCSIRSQRHRASLNVTILMH